MALRNALLATVPALLANLSCGSNGNDNAATCATVAVYPLGCVGDGRPDSTTTPGTQPTTSCKKADYAYFKVHVTIIDAASRQRVSSCSLQIVNSSGEIIEDYALPSGQAGSSTYGCAPGATQAVVGDLSYSSCCKNQEPMQFVFQARAEDDSLVEYGTATANCTPGLVNGLVSEVSVSLTASSCQSTSTFCPF